MYTAERIMAERVSPADGTRQFLVRWEGYTEADDTWEPMGNLNNAIRHVKKYERELKAKAEKSRRASMEMA